MKTDQEIVAEHIAKILPLLKHEPESGIPYPYLSVGWGENPPYSGAIYGWDSYHAALRLAAGGEPKWLRYHTDIFLAVEDLSTGFIPQMISFNGERLTPGRDTYFPFLLQGILVYTVISGDKEWAMSILHNAKLYLEYYEKYQQDPTGLFFWKYCWSGGVDNDAAIAFVPNGSVCPPNINALLYLEYKSMEKLCVLLGKPADENIYRHKADKLRDTINNALWSNEDTCYAPYRRRDGYVGIRLGAYSFLSHTNLMPLYAAIAPKDKASAVIERYLISRDHFFSDWGIRSLSKSSEYYNNAVWGNPPRFDDFDRLTNSNWQGPVWVPANYFMFRALLNYGYTSLAEQVMVNLHKTLANDIRNNGVLHENYNAETGQPLYAPYYGSWNTLADLMPEELKTGKSLSDIFVVIEKK